MLKNKPKLKYCGLTAILSNPSRFDKLSLLTSTGGVLFNELLQPDYNIMQVEVRLMEDKSAFLENTKVIILLGEAAMHYWLPRDTGNNTLNEMRGSPFYINNIPTIASFFPQDAADIKSYEQEFNEQSKEYSGDEETGNDGEDEGDVKRFSNTKRSNYAFWLKCDIEKCKRILRTGEKKWPVEEEPTYKIYGNPEEIINVLTNTKNEYLYFDMETDFEEQNILCFSFAFASLDSKSINVYSVPILNHEYKFAYSSYYLIIRALIISIRDNILVAHNGAAFDFFVLGFKYSIPVYRVYDTMTAMHRCFPDIEKSLGHCVSKWTFQKFHKDSASHAYRTIQHMMDELKYCGKDVFTMILVHRAIDKYARTIPGLQASIDCVNRSIVPYLTTSIQGIRYSQEKVDKLCDENDRLMTQYLRIINMMIGPTGMEHCKKSIKGKAKSLPSSNTQCADYFHEQLGYGVVGRSSKTQKPSLGKKNMFKLALRYDNPVITFILLFRTVQKEYSALRFYPWKSDENKVVSYIEGDGE